ncbi:MBL fold metallo-hydrolase [Alicyclobacillus tolerans]|uniref:MBL fold metallo-hydrolase n=1 Tax=Alicyclobacillus tolerans TaxID=90970 RepID=UPI001F15C594|nr:MBL fold metallo-hydrolase [Alicyclobacillus tolerans]MCF8566442.1 MBL fold metallo-hydrolase [Alicyclobacillus tolerans]
MPKSISVHELHERMNSPEGAFVLDVRASGAYQDWRIQDKGITSVNIQNSKLKEHGPEAFPEIPKDRQIVAVCAKGVSAQETAQMLGDKGYDITYLEGGMGAWSEFYYPVAVSVSDELDLFQVLRPAKGCLSYFLTSHGEAIVVDASRHVDEYLKLAEEKGVKIRHVLDTHLHADHITGGPELAEQTGAKYWIGESEMQGSSRDFNALKDGLKLEFGSSTLEVLAIPTPGHTPGSTSFLVNNQFLLSGDTVFVNGLGRPDLGGKAQEWAKLLYQTVVNKLNKLSDDVIVLPAHYSDFKEITDGGYVGAVLGDLRESNELLQGGDEDVFTESVAGRAGATPPNYETIVQINRGNVHVTQQEASDLEVGPNRCAVKHQG